MQWDGRTTGQSLGGDYTLQLTNQFLPIKDQPNLSANYYIFDD